MSLPHWSYGRPTAQQVRDLRARVKSGDLGFDVLDGCFTLCDDWLWLAEIADLLSPPDGGVVSVAAMEEARLKAVARREVAV